MKDFDKVENKLVNKEAKLETEVGQCRKEIEMYKHWSRRKTEIYNFQFIIDFNTLKCHESPKGANCFYRYNIFL